MGRAAQRTEKRVAREIEGRRRSLERIIGRRAEALPANTELRLDRIEGMEIRAQQNAEDPIGFKGIASVFNKRAVIGSAPWGFLEEIAPGTFTDSIANDDIRMLKNHNDDLPLARNTAVPPSLRLAEEPDTGLGVDADMDPTSYARDLAISLQRRTVSQMSFAFETKDVEWITLDDDDPDKSLGLMEPELRIVKRVKLWEVSPVTFPAYEDTEASLRGIGFDNAAEARRMAALVAELRKTYPDQEVVRALVGELEQPAAIPATTPATASTDDTRSGTQVRSGALALSVAQRRLRLKGREHGLVA